MNIKKTGAVVLSAAAIVVLASGCAGVRSQVDGGAGQSNLGSLQSQVDTQHRESAQARARAHAVPLDASKLAANEAIRAEKQAAAAQTGVTTNRVQEAIRADKQASSHMSAAAAQGARLSQQAAAYRTQVEQHALEQVAPEELRAQPTTTPSAEPTEDSLDTVTEEERRAQHPQQVQE